MLVKFVSTKKEAWSAYLDTCVFAYNTSRHESTKFTPFKLMFGRKATLPIDVELQKASPEEVCQKYHTLDEPNTTAILTEHAQLLETAKKNILVAQQKQKENYDRKHAKPERFQVNQLVLKKDFTSKKTKGGKLKERYLGPYAIAKVLPHGTYELAEPSNKSKTVRATGAHLKPYTAPSPDEGSSEVKDEAFTRSSHPEDEALTRSSHPEDEASTRFSPPEDEASTRSSHPEDDSLSPPNEDEAFILPPPPGDECPEMKISLSSPNGDELRGACLRKETFTIFPSRNELPDEDEQSFLNSSIAILPPPMPSLQVLCNAHLPFPATAPLACSTPRISIPSPPPPESEGDREPHRSKRGRKNDSTTQHSSKRRKRDQKAAEKNVRAGVDAEEEAETVEGSDEARRD